MPLERAWRWFGPADTVSLAELRACGVEAIVTALHEIPAGEVWPLAAIEERRERIAAAGLSWRVAESLPVCEAIKRGGPGAAEAIAHYAQSLRHLGAAGVRIVCYNFMPLLDWVRTDLHHRLPDGSSTMAFDWPTLAAFDCFILQRPGAESDYAPHILAAARSLHRGWNAHQCEALAHTLIVRTQSFIHGAIDPATSDFLAAFRDHLTAYQNIGREQLRENLRAFLDAVIPAATEAGVRLAIHPDDPPFPVLGLPRIVSSPDDLDWILGLDPAPAHGWTLCTGSLGVRHAVALFELVRRHGDRLHFLHLRNVAVSPDGAFHESGHLDGTVDMPAVVSAVLREQARRRATGRADHRLPFRPDHGLSLLDDARRESPPGYPAIGRLRGLSEIRGLATGLRGTTDSS